jgi:hypothetical protein
MSDYQGFCQIKPLHEHQGLRVSQIAHELARDPRTGADWLGQAQCRPRKPSPHASQLDPLTQEIVRLLERYPSAAAQVFQRLRERGFDGGDSLVNAYVHLVRPRRPGAFLTLAFAPGECAQGDWGSWGAVPVGQTPRQRSCLVMGLC